MDSSLLTTTASVVPGVTLEPATMAQSGYVGTAVTYTLRLTNTGTSPDTFLLTVSGNTWNVQLPITGTTLASGVGTDVMVRVNILITATNGLTDTVQLTATGTGVSDSSLLTTTARWRILYLPVVTK